MLRELAARAAKLSPKKRRELLFLHLMTISLASPAGVTRQDPVLRRIRALEKLIAGSAGQRPFGYFKIDPSDPLVTLANSATPDALTERAAAIVLPLLRVGKVTPKMIRLMLEKILHVRAEIHHASGKQGAKESAKGPTVFEKIRAFRSGRKPLSKGEAAKLIRAGRRRKKIIVPGYEGLMAGIKSNDVLADPDAVRGDR